MYSYLVNKYCKKWLIGQSLWPDLAKFQHLAKFNLDIFEGLFSIFHHFEAILAIFYAIGHIFNATNGQKLNKLCSHLVTLPTNHLGYDSHFQAPVVVAEKSISIKKYAKKWREKF